MSSQCSDVFALSSNYPMLLIFDCPTKNPSDYQLFSEELFLNSHDLAIVFLDTEIP